MAGCALENLLKMLELSEYISSPRVIYFRYRAIFWLMDTARQLFALHYTGLICSGTKDTYLGAMNFLKILQQFL